MSQVIFTKIQLTASDMPQSDPFLNMRENRSDIVFEKSDFPGADIHPLYGIPDNTLPYTQQNYYTRDVKSREIDAVLVENDILRAVFLPHCGCRLWSLYHKKKNRELLYVNPVLRFSNFAIRDAWAAGGVEWNIGWQGHTPMTCETLFCERVIDSETGTPVLRFYELERKRLETYEVDAYLPDGREYLFVRVRIKNNASTEMPVYWWSNMAVPESAATRVIVDTDEAFHFHPSTRRVGMTNILNYEGEIDITYPASLKKSVDFFFDIPKKNRKFITALERDGSGLVQASTSLLKGRKEFLWGTHSGGKRWQAFLSDGTKTYLEIQAGLAHTQMESVPLAAGAEFEWLEAYGLMEADPGKVHSSDWEAAKSEVRSKLEDSLSAAFLEEELIRTRKSIVGVPGEAMSSGTGWGALENKRRKQLGLAPLDETLPFPESSIQKEQAPWLTLLEEKRFPEPGDPLAPPLCFQSQPDWIPLLEEAIRTNSNHWFAHYQLGAILYANDRKEEARQEFVASLSCKRTPWSLYALAHMTEGSEACAIMMECVQMLPENFWAIREAMALYNQNGLYSAARKLYEENTCAFKDNGRLRALYLDAVVSMGDLALTEKLLQEPFEIADLREGGLIFHDIWTKYVTQKYHLDSGETRESILKKYPIPTWMDYKMN